jgi:hypothetical protein
VYYRLDWKTLTPDPELANTQACDDAGIPWTMGEHFAGFVKEPLRCSLHPKRGRKMRDLFLVDIPLFSDRLLHGLREMGVDNLQTYRAEIQSPEGVVFTNYHAVNIIGLIACADLAASRYLQGSEPPIMEFTSLVIDETRAKGLALFRLAENSLYILVNEQVQAKLAGMDLVGLSLREVASSTA